MDWIGDKISQLIEEGKKALGKEVVVMSDVKEDEVDDGSGLWEDSDGGDLRCSPSSRYARSLSSPRRKRARPSIPFHAVLGGSSEVSPSGPPAYGSATTLTFPGPSSSVTSLVDPFSAPASATTTTAGWMKESEGDWQSEELKASMERARAMYMAKRRGQVSG